VRRLAAPPQVQRRGERCRGRGRVAAESGAVGRAAGGRNSSSFFVFFS